MQQANTGHAHSAHPECGSKLQPIVPEAFAGSEAIRTVSCTSTVLEKIYRQEKTLLDGLTVWRCHQELLSAPCTQEVLSMRG